MRRSKDKALCFCSYSMIKLKNLLNQVKDLLFARTVTRIYQNKSLN